MSEGDGGKNAAMVSVWRETKEIVQERTGEQANRGKRAPGNLDEDQSRCGGDGGSVEMQSAVESADWQRDEKSRGGAAQKAHLRSAGGATKPEPQVYTRGSCLCRGARCRHRHQ